MKGNISENKLIKKRMEIATELRRRREKLSLTQKQLADKMGITRSTVSKIEDGKWNFGIDTLILFITHLKLTCKITGQIQRKGNRKPQKRKS